MVNAQTVVRGIKNGLSVTWELGKVMVPIYFVITFLKYTPVLPWIARQFAPVMQLMGLPGEASLALVFGFVMNIYASIGVIASLDMTVRQVTIIASVLLICHSLPVETAISKKTGVRVMPLLALRLGLGLIVGILLNLVI